MNQHSSSNKSFIKIIAAFCSIGMLSIIILIIIAIHLIDSFVEDTKESMDNSPSAIGHRYARDIMNALNEHNDDDIYNLFANDVKNRFDIYSQIEETYSCLHGEITSIDPCLVSMNRKVRDGNIEYLSIDVYMPKVMLEDGSNVVILLYVIIVDNDSEKIGLKHITFYENNEIICYIGAE